MSNNQRILILGGYGYLGSYISEQFLRSGWEVFILGRTKQDHFDHHPHTFIAADLTEIKTYAAFIKENKFDLVVNASGASEHNSTDYISRAQALHNKGISKFLVLINTKRYFHFSSIHVYGKLTGEINESSPTNPINNYGQVKLREEEISHLICQRRNIEWTCFRMSNAYGCPHSTNCSQWQLVHNALCRSFFQFNKFELKSSGEKKVDFIYLGDVANLIYLLANKKNRSISNAVHHISRGVSTSLSVLIQEVTRAAIDQDISHSVSTIAPNSAKPSNFIIDNKKTLDRLKVKDYLFRDVFYEEALKIFQLLTSPSS